MAAEPYPVTPTPRPLLTSHQAAATLAISPRSLWSLTARGDLPCVRIGRMVRYDIEDLRRFIDRSKRPLRLLEARK